MPALIGLSPLLADQTFPRDDYQLRSVAIALGNLSVLVEDGSVLILCTDFFKDLLSEFDWKEDGGIRSQIYMHLHLWWLQGKSANVHASGKIDYKPHPIPEGCRTAQGLEEIWADELGKIVVLHDQHSEHGEYFIGIACEKAFSGEKLGDYEKHQCSRFFPLIGPESCDCEDDESVLTNAFEYQVPPNYTQTEVSFENAKKNCSILGASEVENPRRGSHYKVKFPGARSWVLDPNNDPVPEAYLKQLIEITGLNLDVIRYALREGVMPPVVFKLSP
jgi:hypothetical protein